MLPGGYGPEEDFVFRLHYAIFRAYFSAGAMMSDLEYSPRCLISLKVEAKHRADEPALRAALEEVTRGNPDLSFMVDAESGENVIHGASEQHLDIALGALFERGIGANMGAPQVAYREALVGAADIDYTHKKQTGGTTQFALVKLKLEPNETGKGNEFETSMIGGAMPNEYIFGVEKGVNSVWDNGTLIGFPMIDMKVNLCDGAFHEVDSSAIAFEIATRAAMKEGCGKAGVNILEPIMDIEVVTPGDFVGGIIADLSSRRGQVQDQQMRGDAFIIRAHVPLATMFGYISSLGSLSGGRGSHRMSFSHYQTVPRNVASDPGTFPPAIGMRA